jgi:hypothetical protein
MSSTKTAMNTMWFSIVYSQPFFSANIMFRKTCSLLMILTLLLTILFLIPNLLSNTKFLNALFSIQPHKLTQPLFSIQPYIPCNNTSPSTKFPKTNFYNTINQNINKPQTTNGSLSPPHAKPLRKPTANILLNIQFQTEFPAETCKTCREYTGKFHHLYVPTSTTIQNPHNPAQSSLAHQAESHFSLSSLSATTQKQQQISV